jgi:hypothetical protein
VGLERGPLSPVNSLSSYLEEIVAAPGLENRSYDRRDSLRWPLDTPLSAKVGTSFVDRRRSLEFASGLKTTEYLSICDQMAVILIPSLQRVSSLRIASQLLVRVNIFRTSPWGVCCRFM